MNLIVMKRGGQSGYVAINPDKVTHVRSAPGLFTDIFFGEHHVSVEGSFDQIVARLVGRKEEAPSKTWLTTS